MGAQPEDSQHRLGQTRLTEAASLVAIGHPDIGELVAKIFDRLPDEFPGCSIESAMILVELSDPDDRIDDMPATLVMLECSSDRSVIQAGLLEFSRRLLFRADDPEE